MNEDSTSTAVYKLKLSGVYMRGWYGAVYTDGVIIVPPQGEE